MYRIADMYRSVLISSTLVTDDFYIEAHNVWMQNTFTTNSCYNGSSITFKYLDKFNGQNVNKQHLVPLP